MRTFATLKNFMSSEDRDIIVRNLHRILDIVLLDIDIENNTITFLSNSKAALEKTKRELKCIGFPIVHLQTQNDKKATTNIVKTTI